MKSISLSIFIMISTILVQDNRGYIVNVGDKVPIFYLGNSNKSFTEQYKGKVVMIQFTASWCGVCMKEMPFIENEIWQVHKENADFVLIALAKDNTNRPQKEKEIQYMIDKTAVTYPIITDEKSKIFELFAEQKAGVTRNIIIDQNGKIAFLTRLFEKNEFDEMKRVINELLGNN